MSIATLLANPQVLDHAGLEEYLENLADLIPGIERSIARLKREPADRELIAELFRALHNLKGDAAICQVELGVVLTHPVETLLSRLRNGELTFSPALAEIVLLATDRLELAVEALASGRPLAHLKLQPLVEGLDSLNRVSAAQFEAQALQLIETITGARPAAMTRLAADSQAPQAADDLRFFLTLALQFEERAPWFKGRSSRQLKLAQDTNTLAGSPVDALQLEAAIYMHDVGMMFLPEQHWLKSGILSEADLACIRQHPETGAGLLTRMPGWQAAAQMVLQHHERPGGGGYPHGISGEALCDGAKILAIVDTFESIMTRQKAAGQTRSLLRAMAEINASEHQFDPVWIGHFNSMIRQRTG